LVTGAQDEAGDLPGGLLVLPTVAHIMQPDPRQPGLHVLSEPV
jgi:hypothetical protein